MIFQSRWSWPLFWCHYCTQGAVPACHMSHSCVYLLVWCLPLFVILSYLVSLILFRCLDDLLFCFLAINVYFSSSMRCTFIDVMLLFSCLRATPCVAPCYLMRQVARARRGGCFPAPHSNHLTHHRDHTQFLPFIPAARVTEYNANLCNATQGRLTGVAVWWMLTGSVLP